MTKSSFCTAVFRAYYGQPERYRQVEEPQPERPDMPPQLLSSGSKERPYIKMLYPDGRRIEYLFGDHVNMLGALNHRRNGGRLAKFLEDAHDTGIVTHKTDLGTGHKMLSNRQKAEWEREMAKPETPAPDREIDPRNETIATEMAGESQYAVGAQPMDKYAVKKPRSIFDSLPDLSDPGREQKYASKSSRKSKPQQGQTSWFDKNPAEPAVVKVDKLPDMPEMAPVTTADTPSSTAQKSLVAGGESIAPPPTKAPTTVTKTTKARPLSDERRVKGLQDDLGNWFRIHNQDIHGLPPDSAVKLVKYLAHEGRLFRLSHVDHPEHGSFIHVEHGVPSDVPRQGRGTRVEMQAVSPETSQAMKYLPANHPLVELASEMMYGPKDITKTTKTGVRRAVSAGVDPELVRKRASFLANAVFPERGVGKGKLEGLKPSPPTATPPTEPREPVIGGRADETVYPQLPVATGPVVTPPQQLDPKTRRFSPFSLSSSAKQFADAVVEKYTQICQVDDLLQRFSAAYYGEVERYGGQQAGHHIDFEGFNNGIPAATMMQPMKLQSAVGNGPPRHGRGTGAKAGTFAPNPLSGANKYAATKVKETKDRAPTPGQTSLFDAPLSADLPKPEHNVPFGVTSASVPPGKDWHVKALDAIGLAPVTTKPRAENPQTQPATASSPLQKMFTPPRDLKSIPHAELVRLHRQGDKPATTFLWQKIQPSIEYMKKKFPNYTNAIDRLVSKREGEDGSPLPGTFEIAADSYDPTKLGKKSGKPASFSTHHQGILYNYVKQYVERHPWDTDKTSDTGIGEYTGDDEPIRGREAVSREADPADVLLAQEEPSGRQQKQEALNRESFLVHEEMKTWPDTDQWIMEAHLAGWEPKDISSVLQADLGSDQLKFMSRHKNKKLRSIVDDEFRSNVVKSLPWRPTPETVAMKIRWLTDTLRENPTFSKIRQKRENPDLRDAAERFADDVMKVMFPHLFPQPKPQAEPERLSEADLIARDKAIKEIKSRQAAEKRAATKRAKLAPRPLLQLESKNALTAPVEQLQTIPDSPTGHPAPPRQPPLEGNERWALDTGESSDINELKKLHAVATKHGLIFKIKMPPRSTGKQQMESIRWFTFTPAKWKQRFTQRGRPEKYGLAIDVSPHRTYGGTEMPSGQKAPSVGSDVLGAIASGLVGGRRGGAKTARAVATPKQTRQPAGPRPPAPPRALTASEADQLGNEMVQSRVKADNAGRITRTKPGAAGMIDYPDLSAGAEQRRTPTVKPPKTGRTAAQTKSQEDIEREAQTRRDTAIAKSLRAKQSRERAEAIERGEAPPRSRQKKSQSVPTETTQARVTLKSSGTPEGQPIPMVTGGATQIHGEGINPVVAHYAVVNIGDLQPSHIADAQGVISPNPKYKHPDAQPRDYSPGSENHRKVLRHLDDKVSAYWTTDNPDALAGPSTVDEHGQVSNGNGRAVTALIAAQKGDYKWLKDAVIAKAKQYGFDDQQIKQMEQMEHPYLVRVHPGIRSGSDEFAKFAAIGNKETRQTEMPIREAASIGKTVLSQDDLNDLAGQVSGETTIGQVLKAKNHPIVQKLRDRLENTAGYHKFFGTNGQLHESGRDLVEDMILSRFIRPQVLEKGSETRSLKNAIGTALPHLIRIGSQITEPLEKAFEFIANNPGVKSLEQLRDATKRQGALFETGKEVDRVTQKLLEEMYASKNKTGGFSSPATRTLFHEIAKAASDRRRDIGGRSLLGEPETSWLDDVIGAVHKARRKTEEVERLKAEEQKRKSAQAKSPTLFTARRHDAAVELYSAVHAAYYHKVTSPPQRVARKNSAPKRSKVH